MCIDTHTPKLIDSQHLNEQFSKKVKVKKRFFFFFKSSTKKLIILCNNSGGIWGRLDTYLWFASHGNATGPHLCAEQRSADLSLRGRGHVHLRARGTVDDIRVAVKNSQIKYPSFSV